MSLQALQHTQSTLLVPNLFLLSTLSTVATSTAAQAAPSNSPDDPATFIEVLDNRDTEQEEENTPIDLPDDRKTIALNYLSRLIQSYLAGASTSTYRNTLESIQSKIEQPLERPSGRVHQEKEDPEGIVWPTYAAPDAKKDGSMGMDEDLQDEVDDEEYLYDTGCDESESSRSSQTDNRTLNEIPQYVLDYAPYVYLFSSEEFWPCDIAEHLNHVTPNLNYTPIYSSSRNMNLTNLDELNQYEDGRFVYLKSDDNVEERPDWLGGQQNIPDVPEDNISFYHPHQKPDHNEAHDRPRGGRSSAPAFLIIVNKPHGIVDAFWFYFYSYNLGNKVLNVRFGDHIGDWEHSLVRFQHGKPKIVFYSEHFFGQAYSYDAVEKIGKRPVVYSAVGTHANYATPGLQPYILPLGLLHDQTDRGPLWDPLLNSISYTYDVKNDTLRASNLTADAPVEWFYFNGHWGDRRYPMDDRRQYQFAGQYHYVTGPLGPRWKHLGRRKVCQGPYSNKCVVKQWLDAELTLPDPPQGHGEDEGGPVLEECYPIPGPWR